MQKIKDTVGEKGTNKKSDAALVQAILLKIKRPPGSTPAGPYLASYDGDCGPATKAAIQAFQDDHVFVSSDGRACVANPKATAGLVKADDATWQKLLEQVDPDFSDMRVLENGKTVYVAATEEEAAGRTGEVGGLTFTAAFRPKVINCINGMFKQYGIAIGVCPDGDRRDFQTQYRILMKRDGSTHAGPGESNHNFGMAVDMGFRGLRWLKKNGDVTQKETCTMHQLDPGQKGTGEAALFWDALHAVGTSGTVGLFRGPVWDQPHLQNWSDTGIDMATRLADLLTRLGTMRWRGANQAYTCDLGLGGEYYRVGTAEQIWNYQATITVDILKRARAAETQATGQQAQGAGQGAGAAQAPGGGLRAGASMPRAAVVPGGTPLTPLRGPQPKPITQADVLDMQRKLRSQFELADSNWPSWTAR